jgi:hypothetical protein
MRMPLSSRTSRVPAKRALSVGVYLHSDGAGHAVRALDPDSR